MSISLPHYSELPNTDNRNLLHIPGKKGIPVLGMTPWLYKDFYTTVQKHQNNYGLTSRIHIGFQQGVMPLGPDNAKTILLDKERNFSNEMGYKDITGIWFGGAILFRDFDEHRLHRRVFQTAFKSDAMQGYSEGINLIIDNFLQQWQTQQSVLFMPFVKQLLINIGAQIFYGIDNMGSEARKFADAFLLILDKGMMSLVKKDIPPLNYYYGQKGKRFIANHLGSLIADRRRHDGKDFMSYLVKETRDDGSFFTDQELIDHLSFLFFAAFDTTSSGLSHMLMHLAENHRLQEELREESRALNTETVTFQDLDKLPGIEMAFNEALRLYPSASILLRRSIRDCELGGFHIPANTILFTVPGFNHRMPEYWNNPETFDPQRFSTERQEHKQHPFQYIPFGGGAHKCIGMNFAQMNAKLFTHQLLLKYRFKLKPGYRIGTQILPTPCPVDNLPLLIERL